MATKVQFNPSTGKVLYNPSTGKVMIANPIYSECLCFEGSPPEFYTVELIDVHPNIDGTYKLENYTYHNSASIKGCSWSRAVGPQPGILQFGLYTEMSKCPTPPNNYCTYIYRPNYFLYILSMVALDCDALTIGIGAANQMPDKVGTCNFCPGWNPGGCV